jgi:hypothetical protein
MGSLRLATAGALALVTACASRQRFVPASQLERASGDPSAAVVNQSGLTVVADADEWDAYPASLPALMTPVYVRIMNDSDHEIAIRYQDFHLATESGGRLAPLPPLASDRVNRAAVLPQLDARGFHWAPYYRDLFGEDLDYWTGGFAFDPYYYDRYSRWRSDLPTTPMVERALPEGVLEAGGFVAGFLYFPKANATRGVTLEVDLAPPEGSPRIADITIPFLAVPG